MTNKIGYVTHVHKLKPKETHAQKLLRYKTLLSNPNKLSVSSILRLKAYVARYN